MTKYNDLDTLLILALVESNAKETREIQKKALKLMKKVQPIVASAVLKTLCFGTSAQCKKALDMFIEDYLYYALPAAQIGAQGYSGMAIVNKEESIPVSLTFETEEDFRWALKNEEELWTGICKDLLWDAYKEQRTPYTYEFQADGSWTIKVPHEPIVIKADILLFGSVGFKGTPKHWGVELKENEPLFLSELVSDDQETPTKRFRAAKEAA